MSSHLLVGCEIVVRSGSGSMVCKRGLWLLLLLLLLAIVAINADSNTQSQVARCSPNTIIRLLT